MKIFQLLLVITSFGMILSCSNSTDKTKEVKTKQELNQVCVYYFHYNRRCATCNAVENVSETIISELYGDKVSFKKINMDEKEGNEIGKKLGIFGQTLIIISGNQRIDLTNEGFLYAPNNPKKLKQIIKNKIDPLL